jgi:hypothetical protein
LPPFPRGRDLGTGLEDERERVVIRRDARLQHVNVQAQRRRRVAVGSAADVAAHQGVVVEGLGLVQRREDGRRHLHAARPARERARRQQRPRVPRGAVQAQLDVSRVGLPDLVEAPRRDRRRDHAAWLRLSLLSLPLLERRRGGSWRGDLVGLRLRKH